MARESEGLMRKRCNAVRGWLGVLAIALCTLACTMNTAPSEPPPPPIPPLRVGVTADSPPFVLVQGGRVVGIEIDLAARLADHLGRPMEIVNLTWDQLIPTLLD